MALSVGTIHAQSLDSEPAAIVELGSAVTRSLTEHAFSAGPDLAVEFTPIEHWLEIEVGTAPMFGATSREWDTDFLVKKPWTLSRKVEFMFGIGPEWTHTTEHAKPANAVGTEAVLDFMIWPAKSHKLGWFVEPSYEYTFHRNGEHSIGISCGLLIALERR